jgi:hypothetical protein
VKRALTYFILTTGLVVIATAVAIVVSDTDDYGTDSGMTDIRPRFRNNGPSFAQDDDVRLGGMGGMG